MADVGWLYAEQNQQKEQKGTDFRLNASYLDPTKRRDNCCRKFTGNAETIVGYVLADLNKKKTSF